MVFPGDKNASNPPEPTPGQEPQQGQNGQGYVTRDEMVQFQDGLKNTLSDWYQGMQSQTDRYQSRVQQALSEFQRGVDALKAGGVELTPAQLEGAKNKLMLDTLAQGEQAQQQPAPQQPGSDPMLEAYQNTVTASAERLMRAAGVTLEDNDPEVAKYIEPKSEGTVEEYLDAVIEAIEAKKARVAQGPAIGQMPSLTHGGQPASNSIQNITDPTELWQEAMRQGKVR